MLSLFLFLNYLTFLFLNFFLIVFVKTAVCFLFLAMVQLSQLKILLDEDIGQIALRVTR